MRATRGRVRKQIKHIPSVDHFYSQSSLETICRIYRNLSVLWTSFEYKMGEKEAEHMSSLTLYVPLLWDKFIATGEGTSLSHTQDYWFQEEMDSY